MARPDRPLALITGASRGIGLAIARALAPDHDLLITARNGGALERVAGGLRESGGKVEAFPADVVEPEHRQNLFRWIEALRRPVQVLVNNAGIASSAPLADISDTQWTTTLHINLTAPFYLIRALAPRMVEAGWGRVINVSSTAALKGYKYTAAYGASKAGLAGLTRALAVELAGRGVTINAVCPGFVETDMSTAAIRTIADKTGRSESEARASLEKFSPQRRLIQPQEVARIVAHLASDDAASINGQLIAIDGGETA